MAFDGGVTITAKSKLKVNTFYGGASAMQTALRAAIEDGDIIISANLSNGSAGKMLTVDWYDINA